VTGAPHGRTKPAKILVTDGEQRSALAVVRSLGRAGHRVVVCSARRKPLAGASRHSRATHAVPDPACDSDAFTEAVERIADLEDADLLLPVTDASAPLLLGLRARRPDLRVPFPDLATYQAISDKAGLAQVAAELGVPVPRQVVVAAPGARDDTALAGAGTHGLGWPLILKPARSAVHARGTVTKFGVRTAHGPDSLEAELARFPPEAYPILVQERIEGEGLGAFLLGDAEGRPLASFAHRRIREKPPTGGVSVYRESVPLREDLLEYSQRIMTRFRWPGALMLEFKEDASTGTPYLMEANGRFWGSLQLAIDAGVDFPRLLVESALGVEVEPVHTYRLGVRSRWLWGDVDHLLWMLRAPSGYRSQHPYLPGRLEAMGRFLVPWRPGERYEVLRLGDPRPFLRESVQWLEDVLG
jgi:predicted ATP-grasp superfamily ATP-dependent carboligase